MKWEADWWGVTLIAESSSGDGSEDMELLTKLSEILSVKTDKYYEDGFITLEDTFEYLADDSEKKLLDRKGTHVFKIVFHR